MKQKFFKIFSEKIWYDDCSFSCSAACYLHRTLPAIHTYHTYSILFYTHLFFPLLSFPLLFSSHLSTPHLSSPHLSSVLIPLLFSSSWFSHTYLFISSHIYAFVCKPSPSLSPSLLSSPCARTGKLAYISSKTWEQYDAKYSITKRVNEFKRRAMRRATDFNNKQDLSTFCSVLTVM